MVGVHCPEATRLVDMPHRRRVWRKPEPPANCLAEAGSRLTDFVGAASSDSPRLPLQQVKLESVVDVDSDDADKRSVGYASETTILNSDSSNASIFGLRSALHEIEDDDELSDASSQGNDERAMAEKERLNKWRSDNLLQDDLDFAYVFADFEEAYSHAGRAVAVAWSRARIKAEPGMVADMAKISPVEATATKIRKVDERRRLAAIRKKKVRASFLMQPERGAKEEEKDEDKLRFVKPLAQLMMDCKVGRSG